MKKQLCCLIGLLLVAALLTGCGNGTAPTPSTTPTTSATTQPTTPPPPPLEYTNGQKLDLYASTDVVPYYDTAPNEAKRTMPTITPFVVDNPTNDMCVIVCPGGGYNSLSTTNEGSAVAQAFNRHGISAVMLEYRLAGQGYDYRAILSDVFRAVRFVRYHAVSLGIDPDKIVVLGFSAGGHLATMSLEHFDGEFATGAVDEVDTVSSRPDGGVICYGVVSFADESLVHAGSRRNFLGMAAGIREFREQYSGELAVRADMPPAYIWHHKGDTTVPVGNAQALADAMTNVGVANQLHLFEGGKHAGGLWTGQPAGVWLEESIAFLTEQLNNT